MRVEYSRQGNIAYLTLNRPEAFNSLNLEMLSSLASALDTFESDDEAKIGVIRGAGRVFCAGADVEETLPFIREHGSHAIPPSLLSGKAVKKPLAAAISRASALAADWR